MHEEFQKIIERVRCLMVKYTAVQKSHSAKVFQVLYGILCNSLCSLIFLKRLSELSYKNHSALNLLAPQKPDFPFPQLNYILTTLSCQKVP